MTKAWCVVHGAWCVCQEPRRQTPDARRQERASFWRGGPTAGGQNPAPKHQGRFRRTTHHAPCTTLTRTMHYAPRTTF
jgi:hypothetical protein